MGEYKSVVLYDYITPKNRMKIALQTFVKSQLTKIFSDDKKLPFIAALVLCFVVFWPTFLQKKLPLATDILTGYNHPFISIPFSELPFPFPVKNLEAYDTVRQVFPWKYLAIKQFKSGIWPLWNPTQLSGTPLAAEFLTGAFYPLNIIFIFSSFEWGYALLNILQIYLIFITTYFFLKSLRLSTFSALFGASVFSLSGFIAGFFSIGVMGHALLWTPLSLFAINKIFKTKKAVWLILLSISISLTALASHMQILLYSVVLMVFYTIYKFTDKYDKKSLRHSLIGIVSGISLAAIQILPTLELLRNSARINNYGASGSLNLPIHNLLLFLAPDFLGNPGKQNYFGFLSYYHEYSFYVGVTTLLLVTIALGHIKKNKEVLFWFGIFLFTLILTTDNFISHLPLKLNLPILSSITPTRAYAYTDFSLAILGAFGFDYILKRKSENLRLSLLVFTILGLTGFAIMFFNIYFPGLFFWKFLWDTSPTHVTTSLRNLIMPFIIFIVSILAISTLTIFRRKTYTITILSLIFLLTVFDLRRQFLFQNGFVEPGSVFPETRITNLLTSNEIPSRIISTEDRILSPNIGAYYGWENIDGYEPNYIKAYGDAFSEFDALNLGEKKRFSKMISITYPGSPVIDLLGVDYLLSPHPLEEKFLGDFNEVMREGEVVVYENPSSVPRFTLSKESLAGKSDLELMKNKKINFESNNGNFNSSIEIKDYRSDRISLNVTSSQINQILQTMIIKYPGWEVLVNGEKKPLVVSEKGFIGVSVAEGISGVEFRFVSKSFIIGLIISLTSFALCLIFVIFKFNLLRRVFR